MPFCTECGARLEEGAKFCTNCGTKQPEVILRQAIPPFAADTQQDRYGDGVTVNHTEEKAKKTKRSRITALVAVIVLVAAAAVYGIRSSAAAKSRPDLPFSDNPAAITEASRSVVRINCYDDKGELYCTGSGFAMFEQGIIVTNCHVIIGDISMIEAETEDGQSFRIDSIAACDAENDIAILRSFASPEMTLLEPEDTRLQKGEKVVAIGSPLGLLNSVSEGVFSGYVQDNDRELIQFTAAVSHGSSGGPLLNDSGKVIGITSSSYTDAQNINLSVPICDAEDLWLFGRYRDPIKASEFNQQASDSEKEHREYKDYSAWWEGDWYGWWVVYDASGKYEEQGYISHAWDVCATIDVRGDNSGTITLWDEDEELAQAELSFTAGLTDKGCMTSLSGSFHNDPLDNGEWVVDPGADVSGGFDELIAIHGTYVANSGAQDWIEYYIFLRPWGLRWDDIAEGDTSGMLYPGDMLPVNYRDWYLPLVESGASMPAAFEGLQ